MSLQLIEGEPADRRIIVEYGRRATDLALSGAFVLSPNERDTLTNLRTKLGSLNATRNGLVYIAAEVTPYPEETSLNGEDPILSAYSLLKDKDPEKETDEYDENMLLIAVSNPPYVYESQIKDIVENSDRRGSKKEQRLATVYSGSNSEGISSHPRSYVQATLMRPGVDYLLEEPQAGVKWEWDSGANSVVTIVSINGKNGILSGDIPSGYLDPRMTAHTFTRMRNDAIWRANQAMQNLRK